MEQQLRALPFVFTCWGWLDFGLCGGEGFEMGCPSFSQIVHHLSEKFFPFSPAFASRVVLCAGRAEPPLLISNMESAQINFRYIYWIWCFQWCLYRKEYPIKVVKHEKYILFDLILFSVLSNGEMLHWKYWLTGRSLQNRLTRDYLEATWKQHAVCFQ